MASQTAATKSKDSAVPVEVQKGTQHAGDRANDAIARRAYSLYLAGGGGDGQDLAHWLQAESEILTPIPDIREFSNWYTVSTPVHGFSPEQIQVAVDEKRVIICADKRESSGEAGAGNSSSESLYLVAEWPKVVDASTASAYVKNDGLTLTVKRAEGAKPSA
jgi:HSP20 family molecular chaperone IbpA